jgi:hypothetical protein
MAITYHGWDDWEPSDLTPINGVHRRIKKFIIPSGFTIPVAPYDGIDPETGMLEIWCREAIISGALEAAGKGYGGGGAGGGGGGGSDYDGTAPGGGGGSAGVLGVAGDAGASNNSHSASWSGAGGRGGSWGTAYGLGGAAIIGVGNPGGHGGYLISGGNGEALPFINEDIKMGSGGGGASGGNGGPGNSNEDKTGGGGGGGGAGGYGGGLIKIYAQKITVSGSILASGVYSGNGSVGGNGVSKQGGAGGAGGSALVLQVSDPGAGGSGSPQGGSAGSAGGHGGAGGGGGILFICSRGIDTKMASMLISGRRIKISGSIENTSPAATNGGTFKQFAPSREVSGTVTSGNDAFKSKAVAFII